MAKVPADTSHLQAPVRKGKRADLARIYSAMSWPKPISNAASIEASGPAAERLMSELATTHAGSGKLNRKHKGPDGWIKWIGECLGFYWKANARGFIMRKKSAQFRLWLSTSTVQLAMFTKCLMGR